MARGGGSGGGFSGGSRSSGGSFGGSRSSGGRSGGSFGGISRGGSSSRSGSSFGGFSRGRSGSSNSGGRSGSPFGGIFGNKTGSGFTGGSNYGNRYSGYNRSYTNRGQYYGSSGPSGYGCGTIPVGLIIVVVIFILIFSSGLGSIFSSREDSPGITASTIRREALPAGSVNETGYYYDGLGWINSQSKLLDGLKYFYKKTGVQPYLHITDTVNGSHFPSTSELDEFMNSLYDELFTDEAHLLLVFFEYEGSYMDRYVGGTQAKTVIDAEAADVLLDYIDRYYYDNGLTDEEFFSKAFRDTADRIMTVTKSPWINVFMVLGILSLAVLLFTWWKRFKKQKNLEAEQTEQMLKTPLEKFGDREAEDLARKYEDDNKE